MKTITLTQPYATLVAIGAKKIETRSWATSYRGPLAIHAGKGPGSLGWMEMQHLCLNVEPFKSVLGLKEHPANVLPLGRIVAICELVGCQRIGTTAEGSEAYYAADGTMRPIWGQERAFGDYTPGRWAWLLSNIRALPKPIPAKGALSLWEWQPPEGFPL